MPLLIEGAKYRVVHKTSNQRYPRQSVMVYLGKQKYSPGVHAFSARPAAGTQHFPESEIISAEIVRPETVCFMNRRAAE